MFSLFLFCFVCEICFVLGSVFLFCFCLLIVCCLVLFIKPVGFFEQPCLWLGPVITDTKFSVFYVFFILLCFSIQFSLLYVSAVLQTYQQSSFSLYICGMNKCTQKIIINALPLHSVVRECYSTSPLMMTKLISVNWEEIIWFTNDTNTNDFGISTLTSRVWYPYHEWGMGGS